MNDKEEFHTMKETIRTCQSIITQYLIPDGPDRKETLSALIYELDNPAINKVVGRKK